MNPSLAIVLALLGAAIGMFAMNRPRMDAVGLIMLTVLPLTGVITIKEALAGFSDPNVVLIAMLFVIGEGLVRTGIAQRLGDWLIRKAGASETRLIVLLMLVVSTLGAFMSSTGVVAIFIPVALRIAQSTGMAASQLMMPISVAALISGMMTLVATPPNLVVNGELARHGEEGFHFFSFTPLGIPVLIVGIVYLLFARRWLTVEDTSSIRNMRPVSLLDWVEKYQLAEREFRVRVTPQSPLVGKTLEAIDLNEDDGFNVVAVERKNGYSKDVFSLTGKEALQANDVLLVDTFVPRVNIHEVCLHLALEELPLSGTYFSDRSQEIGMAEVMIATDSSLVGKTVIEARFRSRFRLTVVGLRHGQRAIEHGHLTKVLGVGDTLLLVGPWKEIDRLQAERTDLVLLNLPAERSEVLLVPGKASQALVCLLLMVGLMVGDIVPNVQAALIACLMMGAFRCVDLDSAYRAIHWKSLILIVGMLPFSVALQRTGGVDLAADSLMAMTAGSGIHVLLASLFAITALLGLFVSNTATAVLMAPVAIAIAAESQASPYPFAMIVAMAASTAFMTPISSPVNTLVMGPGNYKFGDFVRVGVPLSLIVMVISVLLVPWMFPIYPS